MTTFHTKNCLQGQKNLTVIVILIWKYNTHTQKKYVDDYHTASSIFHQLKKSLPLAEIALENRPRVILKTQLSKTPA